MKTVIVNTILSEEGLLAIREVALLKAPFLVKETSTNTTWNTNGWSDCWMKKVGTSGATTKTRKRFSIGLLENLANELKWKNIQASNELLELVALEIKSRTEQYAQTQATIDAFNDVEIAKVWKQQLNEKNSQGRRSFAMQRLFKMGCTLVSNGQAREFERKIESL
jgi:hypothetical protein